MKIEKIIPIAQFFVLGISFLVSMIPITRLPTEEMSVACIWWLFSATIFAVGVFINTYLSSIAAKNKLEALDIQFRGTRLINFESVGRQIEDLRKIKQLSKSLHNKELVDIELSRIGDFWKVHTTKKTLSSNVDLLEMKESILQKSFVSNFLEFQKGNKTISQILGMFSLVNSTFNTNFTVVDADKVITFISEEMK